jgi:hypothetical protein
LQEQTDRLGQYCTLDGAAKALGVTYYMVVGFIRRKNVPTLKLGGKQTLVRLSDLDGIKEKRA